jgi:HAD superfamily hydrolase (TIGR01459 family)
VLHDGVSAFPEAIRACRAFRGQGGTIVLISNSPHPSRGVLTHLKRTGFPGDCFDSLVTSGDVTRQFVEAFSGDLMFHIGPERDKLLFEGLNVKFGPRGEAKSCVCTGFFNEDVETAEEYDPLLASLAERGVPMICANPDLYVERGSKLLPCAGLLAVRYAALGQTVFQAGKPYDPIYEAALGQIQKPLAKHDILAIGDGIDTDIRGAASQGIDSIYVASKVHLPEGQMEAPLDSGLLDRLFAGRPFGPLAAMAKLAW